MNNVRVMARPQDLDKEWYTPAELAELRLPEMPSGKHSRAETSHKATREGWQDRVNMAGEPLARRREGKGGGWEYHYTLLPALAQMALIRRTKPKLVETDPRGRSEHWDWFSRQPETKKASARAKAEALKSVHALWKGGLPKNLAVCEVAHTLGKAPRTVFNWLEEVAGVEEADWLPHLCPRHVGRTVTVECSPEAWEFLKGDFLRQSKRPFEICYEDLRGAAGEHGWTIPSARTLRRRIESEIPHALMVYLREGDEALRRLYPYQERDRTCFHALEAVNADNHTIDVRVRFPDGAIDRPSIIAVQDLYSNKMLGWRVDLNPTATGTRLCFYDVFRDFGIPSLAFLDNGREFAAKLITGGQPTRYRFKVTAGDMDGVLTSVGIQVHWCKPYSGQSKPIERAFKEFCQAISTHPAFEGAYVGSSPEKRPENSSRAVEFDEFMGIFAEGVRQYNARPKRRTPGVRRGDELRRGLRPVLRGLADHAGLRRAAPHVHAGGRTGHRRRRRIDQDPEEPLLGRVPA